MPHRFRFWTSQRGLRLWDLGAFGPDSFGDPPRIEKTEVWVVTLGFRCPCRCERYRSRLYGLCSKRPFVLCCFAPPRPRTSAVSALGKRASGSYRLSEFDKRCLGGLKRPAGFVYGRFGKPLHLKGNAFHRVGILESPTAKRQEVSRNGAHEVVPGFAIQGHILCQSEKVLFL